MLSHPSLVVLVSSLIVGTENQLREPRAMKNDAYCVKVVLFLRKTRRQTPIS
jgi:hypothetical protein